MNAAREFRPCPFCRSRAKMIVSLLSACESARALLSDPNADEYDANKVLAELDSAIGAAKEG